MNQNYKKIVCLIHSDQDTNDLFKTFLEYHGYKVHGFTIPSEGLLSFENERYDIVLMGLVFSEMSGLRIYKRLKEIYNKVRILIVTANLASAELIQDIYPETKHNILYEPITLNELKQKIESVLLRY